MDKKKNDSHLIQPTLMVHSDTVEKPVSSKYLTSLWIETPANCVLQCPMCFASTIPLDKEAPQFISNEAYLMIIKDFIKMDGNGRKTLAIPGAGEPFHHFNRKLTWKIIELTAELEMPLTVFTTAHLMEDEDIIKLRKYKNVLLLVKYNSKRKDVQEALVFMNLEKPTDSTYFEKREEKFQKLIDTGFNEKPTPEDKAKFGFDTRLGIVTSIMEKNIDEIVELHHWARSNNLIFDCDTILPRGRGESFNKKRDELSGQALDRAIREKIYELQMIDKKNGIEWSTGGTYVGSKCTRFSNHLYIDVKGNVHPCIGAMGVVIDNIVNYKSGQLKEIWESPLMKPIREHRYTGTCSTCLNFLEGNCYSCLGRCTIKDVEEFKLNNENLSNKGVIFTRGCLNYRPQPLVLISEKTEKLSKLFGRGPEGLTKAREYIRNRNLELLWTPEQDLIEPSTEEVRIWKDHYLDDLISAPWRWDYSKRDELPRLLGKYFLPIVSSLFDINYDMDEMLLWVNLLLYDEFTREYFYRIVVRDKSEESRRTILLSRWAESEGLYDKNKMSLEEKSVLYSERILDLSDVLREPPTEDGERFNYRIIFTREFNEICQNKEGGLSRTVIYDASHFISDEDIKKRIKYIKQIVKEILKKKAPGGQDPVELLMRKRLIPKQIKSIGGENITIGLNEDEQEFVKNIYAKIAHCFYKDEEAYQIQKLPSGLIERCEYKKSKIKGNLRVLLGNYLIFIKAMHEELAGYEVRHSYIHAESVIKQPAGVVLASRLPKSRDLIKQYTLTPEQLSEKLLSVSDIMMRLLISPINRIYEEEYYQKIVAKEEVATFSLGGFVHFGVSNLLSPIREYCKGTLQTAAQQGVIRKQVVDDIDKTLDYLSIRSLFLKFLAGIGKIESIKINIVEVISKFCSDNLINETMKKKGKKDYSYHIDTIVNNKLTIKTIPGALELILENLMANVFKWSKRDDRKITICIKANEDNIQNGILIEFSDNGEFPLISKDNIIDLSYIEESLQMSRRDDLKHIAERGFGLRSVCGCVERIGGKISVEYNNPKEEKYKGLKFLVFIPHLQYKE